MNAKMKAWIDMLLAQAKLVQTYTAPVTKAMDLLGLLMTGYTALKGLITKKDKYSKLDKAFNLVVAGSLLALSLTLMANPLTILSVGLGTAVIGAAVSCKGLVKSVIKNAALKQTRSRLEYKLKNPEHNAEELKALNKEIKDISDNIHMRNYKIVQRSVNVVTATLVLTAAAIALAIGPVGWGLAAAATVIGITTKVALYAYKRYALDKAVKENAAATKKSPQRENDFLHFLYERTQGLLGQPRVRQIASLLANDAIVAAETERTVADVPSIHHVESAPRANASSDNSENVAEISNSRSYADLTEVLNLRVAPSPQRCASESSVPRSPFRDLTNTGMSEQLASSMTLLGRREESQAIVAYTNESMTPHPSK